MKAGPASYHRVASRSSITFAASRCIAGDEVVPVRHVVEIIWSGNWSYNAADFFKNELKVKLI